MPNSDLWISLCLTPEDFTLSNARRFYSSKGTPRALKVNHKLEFRCYLWLVRSMQLDGLCGENRLMAYLSWVVNEDTRMSAEGLGPRLVNQSHVVTHLPNASILD